MTRFVAFLRAINVGPRVVKMERLREWFVRMGFRNVETFIASGNVIFESRSPDEFTVRRKIEQGLSVAMGHESHVFLRTPAEVVKVAQHAAFTAVELSGAAALNVAFLEGPLDEAADRSLARWHSENDVLRVHGRELYWLCRVKQSDSKFSNAVLERATRGHATMRGLPTVTKLAEKYPPG